MNKLLEETTVSVLSYPTTSTGKSASTTFVDISQYRNAKFETTLHRLPDAKGEGVATMTVYEHTQSTWAGVATAVTSGIVTGSITSAADLLLQDEVKSEDISVNNSKRYLNAYITLPTGVQVACTVTRWGPRYEPQI